MGISEDMVVIFGVTVGLRTPNIKVNNDIQARSRC